jgi:hypothetical protein
MLWENWTRQAEKSQEIKDNLFPFLVSQNIIVTPQQSYYGVFNKPQDYARFSSAKIILNKNDECIPDKTVNDGKCVNGVEMDGALMEDYFNAITESEVEMIDNQRWSAVLKHLTKFPTFERPKITQLNNQFKVAPREVGVVVLNYYKKPQEAVFAYTIARPNLQTGAGNQIIYNAAQSRPLEWSPTVKNEFLINLGIHFGIFTRDQFMFAFNSQLKQQP